jgi:hypothetical protein
MERGVAAAGEGFPSHQFWSIVHQGAAGTHEVPLNGARESPRPRSPAGRYGAEQKEGGGERGLHRGRGPHQHVICILGIGSSACAPEAAVPAPDSSCELQERT